MDDLREKIREANDILDALREDHEDFKHYVQIESYKFLDRALGLMAESSDRDRNIAADKDFGNAVVCVIAARGLVRSLIKKEDLDKIKKEMRSAPLQPPHD